MTDMKCVYFLTESKHVPCARHEGKWGSETTAQLIFNLLTLVGSESPASRPGRFTPRHSLISRLCGPRAGPDALENKKISQLCR